jgi:hypothetical protein
MTRESEFKLKMPGNFNEDNWGRGCGAERRRTVDDRAPWAAKPPTAAISLPLRRIGASGNSAAAAPHHDRGIVRAMAADELAPKAGALRPKNGAEGADGLRSILTAPLIRC